MTEPTPADGPIRKRKSRAQERRDRELIEFCNRMAKDLSRSQDVRDRADVRFFRDLAVHIELTDGTGAPLLGERKPVPTTARLEKWRRAIDRFTAQQSAEVAQLRGEGMSWELIGQALGMTREGARRRFSK